MDASEKQINGGRLRKHSGGLVGRSLVLPAGTELWGWATGDVDFLRLELHPDAVRAAGEGAERSGMGELRPQVQLDDPVLWHLACVLRADMAMGCPGGQVLRDGVQSLIAHHLTAARPTDGCHSDLISRPLSSARLRTVRDFVRANLHRDLRLAEMAAASGLSTHHFARAFKATTGVPPYRYVLEERLSMACKLLDGSH